MTNTEDYVWRDVNTCPPAFNILSCSFCACVADNNAFRQCPCAERYAITEEMYGYPVCSHFRPYEPYFKQHRKQPLQRIASIALHELIFEDDTDAR